MEIDAPRRRRSRTRAPRLAKLAVLGSTLTGGAQAAAQAPVLLFEDDFESGLDGWHFPYGAGHQLVATGGAGGTALRMAVEALPVYALVAGSETWGDVRVEGRVLFPTEQHAYLGFIYHYRDDGRRLDFGSAYIKGNDGYVQANEHHDTNVGRTFYPELRTHLTGPSAVVPGIWQRFALEVVGDEAHLYVGDLRRPVLTLPGSARTSGAIGFKPRNPGAPVLIDDVRVWSIDGFSWRGPPAPDVGYRRDEYLTDWSVLAPLTRFVDTVERGAASDGLAVVDDGRALGWQKLTADHRGSVPTGRFVEYRGARRVAYFRARFTVAAAGPSVLRLSSTDDVAVWVDGRFEGFAGSSGAAWFDAAVAPDRPTLRLSDPLEPGEHEVVVRVVGGIYATGGFYAWLAEPS